MELETDSSSDNKKQLVYKTKKYQSELKSLVFQFEAIQAKYVDGKASEALMVDISDDSIGEKSLNKRQKLISNEDLYWQSEEKLENTKRKVLSIEKNGNNIIFDLASHSNSMRSIVTNLEEVENEAQISTNWINKMQRRVKVNKVAVLGTAAALSLVLLYLLF